MNPDEQLTLAELADEARADKALSRRFAALRLARETWPDLGLPEQVYVAGWIATGEVS